jgi:hypothetical protein
VCGGASSIVPTTCEAEIGGSQFKARPGKLNTRPYLKNKLKVKKMGGMAQVVESLKFNSQYHEKTRN